MPASLMSVTESPVALASRWQRKRPRPGQVREQLDRPPVTVEQAGHPTDAATGPCRSLAVCAPRPSAPRPPPARPRRTWGRCRARSLGDLAGEVDDGRLDVGPAEIEPDDRGDRLPGNVRFATAWLLMSAPSVSWDGASFDLCLTIPATGSR